MHVIERKWWKWRKRTRKVELLD